MRILHVISGDLMAGAEHMALALCAEQTLRQDAIIGVILLNSGPLANKLKDLGIYVYICEEKTQSIRAILRSAWQFMRQFNPAIVHTHRIKENVLGGVLARLARVPSIRTVHGAPEHRFSWYRWDKRVAKALDNISARYFQSCCVAVSQKLAGQLRKEYPAWRVETIENGVNPDAIRTRASAYAPPVHRDRVRVTFLGRLVPVKGVSRILKAVHEFRKRYNDDVELVIAGDGPLHTELQSEAKQLDILPLVQFLGHLDNPLPWLAASDALILASDHEGMPMCVLESLALGKPVISPRLGGIERILNSSNSILIDNTNPQSISDAIAAVANTDAAWSIELPASCSAAAMEKSYFEIYTKAQ